MLGIARADLTDFDVLRRLGGINVPAAVVSRPMAIRRIKLVSLYLAASDLTALVNRFM